MARRERYDEFRKLSGDEWDTVESSGFDSSRVGELCTKSSGADDRVFAVMA